MTRYAVELRTPLGRVRIDAGVLLDAWIHELSGEPLGLDPEVIAAIAASEPEEGDWLRGLRAAAIREQGERP